MERASAEQPANIIDLDALLRHRASQPAEGGQVFIEGAWVARTPSVPTDGGVQMVVRFAERAWRRNLEMQRDSIEAERYLAQAEIALLSLTETGLNRDVAIALAAVQKARELL